MESSRYRPTTLLWFLALGCFHPVAVRADDASTSSCPVGSIPSVDLAPPAFLSSPLHKVAPCTVIDGHMARFTLDTRWGEVEAVGVAALETRIDELSVLETLGGVSVAGESARAAGSALSATAGTVVRVIASPIEGLRRLPQGTVDYVGRELTELGEDAREIGDESYDTLTGRDQFDPVGVRPGAFVGSARDDDAPWWKRGGTQVGKFTRRWIGFDKARRQVAERYEVDPYTSNAPLAERLDELAWGATAGQKVVGYGLGQAGIATRNIISGSRRINRVVWEESPADIARWNRERLDEFGCDPAETRRFVRNSAFSPTIQTTLVDALIELAPESGCEHLLDAAETVQDDVDARFLASALVMAVDETERRGLAAPDPAAIGPKRTRIELFGHTPVFKLPGGTLLLALPVDRLEWTPATRVFFDREGFRVQDKVLRVGGRSSARALAELTRRGWEIAETP